MSLMRSHSASSLKTEESPLRIPRGLGQHQTDGIGGNKHQRLHCLRGYTEQGLGLNFPHSTTDLQSAPAGILEPLPDMSPEKLFRYMRRMLPLLTSSEFIHSPSLGSVTYVPVLSPGTPFRRILGDHHWLQSQLSSHRQISPDNDSIRAQEPPLLSITGNGYRYLQ